jgi:ABC-2 type transport system permease protein
MKAIYQKELKSYFYTPTGWLFIAVFLAIASLVFYLNNLLPRGSDLMQFLSMMSYVWMLLSPILVMRLLAGERRQATDNLLMSAPLRVNSLVIGKFLAACTVMLLAVALSLLYPILLSFYAKVYPMEVLTGYLGFLLQGCAFIALGMMVTSNLKNAVTAAAVAFGVNLFLWLASLLTNSASIPQAITKPLSFLSLYERFVPFLTAQLSVANVLFYMMFCVSMLAVTVLVMSHARNKTR